MSTREQTRASAREQTREITRVRRTAQQRERDRLAAARRRDTRRRRFVVTITDDEAATLLYYAQHSRSGEHVETLADAVTEALIMGIMDIGAQVSDWHDDDDDECAVD